MELHRARQMRCVRASLFVFVVLAITIGSPAQAQSVADLAAYGGVDRTQRLVDGARKENALMIYSSMTVADMGVLINAFQAKYGVKAQHWRGSSEDIRNRITREYSASRYDADLAETAGTDMEAMVREQVLQKVVTPVSKELIPQATFAHGQWIATRLSARLDVANESREGTFALISPVTTSTLGRCVASTRWIPAARASWVIRTTASSTSRGAIIIRSASSSTTTTR